jgi:hypothetical protein
MAMADGMGELELEFELEGEGEGEAEFESEFEQELETEFESELEGEAEGEFETEGEFEFFANPVNRIYPDAMMEHMGLAAMEAETEFEAAEHFLPLIPLAASKLLPVAARLGSKVVAKALPHVARTVARATPRLTRSVTNIARTLHRNPATRPMLRAVPTVARRAVARIAHHAAAGRQVTPRHAAHILRRESHRVLHNPRLVHGIIRRAHQLDRRSHQLTGLPAPHRHPHHLHQHALRHGGWQGHPHYLRYGQHPHYVHYRRRLHPAVLAAQTAAGVPPSYAAPTTSVTRPRHAHLQPAGQFAGGVCPTCGRGPARCCCC